jgi:hypothetical protein
MSEASPGIPHSMAVDLGRDGFEALARQMQATVEAETGAPHVWWLDPRTRDHKLIPRPSAYVEVRTAADTC